MVNFRFVVTNPSGLQAKEAGELVKEAIKCTGSVTIRKGERSGNAKLIFHVLSLGAKENDEIEISVEGENEQEEGALLEKFVRTLF